MKTLSLTLQEPVLADTEALVAALGKPRDAYINEALVYYNRLQRQHLLANQLGEESRRASASSQAVLREFEALEDPLPN